MTRDVAIKAIQDFIGWFKEESLIRKALEMAIKALSQEPCEECKYKTFTELYFHTDPEMVEQEPCDEKRDCSTCKYEEYSSNYQPCRDCGTLLESYTNWEQKERELPCDDVVSRKAVLQAVSEGCQEWRGIYGRCEELINELPSVTQKSGKWKQRKTDNTDWWECSECGAVIYSEHEYDMNEYHRFCGRCGACMKDGRTLDEFIEDSKESEE